MKTILANTNRSFRPGRARSPLRAAARAEYAPWSLDILPTEPSASGAGVSPAAPGVSPAVENSRARRPHGRRDACPTNAPVSLRERHSSFSTRPTRGGIIPAALIFAALCLLAPPTRAATNDLTSAIQRGLFEEEANQNLGAAIQAYQTVAGQFDKDRKLAATAIFRLGECYRKQGNTNDAATQYERILREFSDQPTLVTLSRQNLAALGSAPPAAAAPVLSDAARQEQKRLLEEEIELVQKQLDMQQKQFQGGVIGQDALFATQRDLLKLRRQVAALDAGLPVSIPAAETAAPAASTEADEIRRIQALIKESPDLINAPDQIGETLLQSAAAKGKLAVVKLLLDNGAAVDGLQQPGLTALHYAAGNGHKAIVDFLLSKGAKPGAQTGGGVTPLHLAARKGYEEVAKALLAAGAPAKAKTTASENHEGAPWALQYSLSTSGQTPLHLAASAGYTGLVELLLAKGADANAENGDGRTPLNLVASAGYTGLVELLLAKGADANAEDGNGQTPLSYAAQKPAIMQLLLATHANPNAGRVNLPLARAAFEGDMPTLKLLLANGADPNTNSTVNWSVNTRNGQFSQGGKFTPLFLAVSQHKADAVREMLRGKADPNLPGPGGNPLLYETLSDTPTLKVLLEGGADPNARTSNGKPMLEVAVGDRNQPAVELLLAHQADANAATASKWTPLTLAAALTPSNGAEASSLKAIAGLLLKAGADVKARDKDGNTPLHYAVMNGQQDLVELLLANKADPNLRNNGGKTPLDLAKSQAQSAQGRPPGALGFPAMNVGFPTALPQRQAPGTPATAPGQEAKPETMADLLRRHGALDDLPHLDQIGVRRSTISFAEIPFTKGTHDWSEFTLLELIAVQYELLAAGPDQGGGSRYGASSFFGKSRLLFPDLAHLHISRPAADMKSWQDQVVDLSPVLASGECAKDVRLRWGDVVEIPEADHPLNEGWAGLSSAELANLKKCLTRKVEIVVKGQATTITLAPMITGLEGGQEGAILVMPLTFPNRYEPAIFRSTPFWLRPVLLQSKLVLISSDLARVKVTRRDPATGKTREWVVDCSKGGDSAPNLWLQDGDRIEVPEKTYTLGAQAEAPPAAAPGMASPPAPAQPGPFNFVPPPSRILRAPAAQTPQGVEQQPPFTQRLQNIISRGSGTPQAAEDEHLSIGGVVYSPKPDDPEFLKAGYHKDRAAKTRKAECWEQRAGAELKGRACPAVWSGTDLIVFGGEGPGTSYDDGARYCFADDRWAALPQKGAPSSRTGHAAVWTGKEMIIWGGFGGGTNGMSVRYGNVGLLAAAAQAGAQGTNGVSVRFGSALLTADQVSVNQQSRKVTAAGHVRLQSEGHILEGEHVRFMSGNNTNHNDGARYDPSSDTWKPVTTKNAPDARFDFPAVWTGREMLVWGGYTDSHSRYQGGHADAHLNTGGRYDPSSDSWKSITTQGAPSKRCGHTLVWTGKEMIVWGGGNTTKALNDGGRYSLVRNSWKPVGTDGAPSPRANHVAVWTGKEMIVWGGTAREPQAQSDYYENGARYNPETDAWKPISTVGAPKGRVNATAVWTGTEMIVWGGVNDAQAGGVNDSGRYVGSGARYNPATDTWTEMTATGAPPARLTSAVWTGEGLLTFGGYNGTHLNDTWFYSPSRTLYAYVKQ